MRLKKFDLNTLSVTALGIGSMVGAGIFALLGEVVLQAGAYTYYAFIISGIAAMLTGYSYARLASAFPQSGGLTSYFNRAFKGKFVSGGLSVIYLLTSYISVCMMAKSFGIYAADLFTGARDYNTLVNIFAVLLIVSIAYLNMRSFSDVGDTEIFMVAFKLIVLVSLIAFAAKDYTPQTVSLHNDTPGLMAFIRSIGITFFAYAGFGIMTNASAEVNDPQKTITRSIYLAIGIVILLYMGLAFVILNYISPADISRDADTAVAIAARKLMGEAGYVVMYAAAAVAFISGTSATFFSTFKISRSLSRQKVLPEFYNKKFWRHGTWGNALSILLVVLATVYFNFDAIVNLASASYLVSYLGIFIANWKLRRYTLPSAFLVFSGFFLLLFISVAFIISIY